MRQQTEPSKPEQLAAPVLARYGFIPCQDQFFPMSFRDKDGRTFNAKPDSYNPALGIYVEIKDNHLNEKTCIESARKARQRAEAWGVQNEAYCQIQNDWNHAAAKQAIVQDTLTPARFIVVFTGKPDPATLKRVKKFGIECYSLDRFSWYMLRWRLGQYRLAH